MIKTRKGNPYAALTVLAFIVILFIGYWIMVPIYANLHNIFHDDSDVVGLDEAECKRLGNYWENGVCSNLPDRAKEVISYQRMAWLAAPFIFFFSLLVWFWTRSMNRDTQEFQG